MRGSLSINPWHKIFLSLLLLVANVFAPFRTSSFGRAFLDLLTHTAANQPVVRVRAVTSIATSIGHRAVVGLSRRGPDVALSLTRLSAYSAFLATSTVALPCRQAARAHARPIPRLRC